MHFIKSQYQLFEIFPNKIFFETGFLLLFLFDQLFEVSRIELNNQIESMFVFVNNTVNVFGHILTLDFFDKIDMIDDGLFIFLRFVFVVEHMDQDILFLGFWQIYCFVNGATVIS